jgi:hypothetical protein
MRRRCRRGSHREHPRLQHEGCSPQTLPSQVCPLWQRSEAAQSNGSSRWQVQPQWNLGSLHPYTNMNSKQQVSQLGLQM